MLTSWGPLLLVLCNGVKLGGSTIFVTESCISQSETNFRGGKNEVLWSRT